LIISINEEKAFNKIQHHFMIKVLRKLGIEGMYLNIVKSIYDKPTANIILNGEKLKPFPIKIRNETRVPILPTPIQHRSNRQEEEIKGIQIDKETAKISLFEDGMNLYLKDPKNSTEKLRHHKHLQ
jgi:hypothetical protein